MNKMKRPAEDRPPYQPASVTFAGRARHSVRAILWLCKNQSIKFGHRSLNHVLNVSIIAARRAVPKLIDGLPGVNATGELMNGQIRPLPRTVHSEVTKCHYTKVVEM